MELKYIHTTELHNLTAPRLIVPMIIDLFSPHSVVDVGCGLGTFLHVFAENGIDDIFGMDGSWVNYDLLSQNIPLDKFKTVDLENVVTLNRKFDIALCLEVAEHLPKECANNLVETLTQLSDIIIFSAAVPNQGGQNHVNEQWPSYWENIFEKYDFKMYDILRYRMWDNPNIFRWYKQNMFVVARKGLSEYIEALNVPSVCPHNIVHPEQLDLTFQRGAIYRRRAELLNEELSLVLKGEKKLMFYFKLLLKCILRRLKLYK